jgi:hypothetical protein
MPDFIDVCPWRSSGDETHGQIGTTAILHSFIPCMYFVQERRKINATHGSVRLLTREHVSRRAVFLYPFILY